MFFATQEIVIDGCWWYWTTTHAMQVYDGEAYMWNAYNEKLIDGFIIFDFLNIIASHYFYIFYCSGSRETKLFRKTGETNIFYMKLHTKTLWR